MKSSAMAWRSLLLAVIACAGCSGSPAAHAGDAAQAMTDYMETVRQADSLVASDPHEAVRLYERAGRIAYNNTLSTDSAALNTRLAAARRARDAKATSTLPAPATPSSSNPVLAGSPADPAAAAKAGSAEDALAWFQYGDGLVAGREYIDAIRAYERGRRLAINNRVPYDRTALDAKIAAANQAAKAPRPKADLIPEPLPPLPLAPGSLPQETYLSDRPGKVRSWSTTALYSRAEFKVTSTELKAFDANLHRIMDVISHAPVLSPPVGFELAINGQIRYITDDAAESQRYIAARLPLRGSVSFYGLTYFEIPPRTNSTGAAGKGVGVPEETTCGEEIRVNEPPVFESDGRDRFIDEEETYFLEPPRDGELGGVPVYGDTLTIAPPGATLWLPVSTEQALKLLLPRYKRAADGATEAIAHGKQKYLDFMSTASQEKRRREVEAERAQHSEANARKLELMQHRWEEDARKEAETAANDPKWRGPIDAYQAAQALQAGLDPGARAAPACIVTGPFPQSVEQWRVVPVGTPDCRALAKRNPGLVNGKLPRSELQILYVPHVTRVNRRIAELSYQRGMVGDCVAMARILRQTDWSQLAGLLAR